MLSEKQPRLTFVQAASAISRSKYALCGAMALHNQSRCSSRLASSPSGDASIHRSSGHMPKAADLVPRRSPALCARDGKRPVSREMASCCAPTPAISSAASKRKGEPPRTGSRTPISRCLRRRDRSSRLRIAVLIEGIRMWAPGFSCTRRPTGGGPGAVSFHGFSSIPEFPHLLLNGGGRTVHLQQTP